MAKRAAVQDTPVRADITNHLKKKKIQIFLSHPQDMDVTLLNEQPIPSLFGHLIKQLTPGPSKLYLKKKLSLISFYKPNCFDNSVNITQCSNKILCSTKDSRLLFITLSIFLLFLLFFFNNIYCPFFCI